MDDFTIILPESTDMASCELKVYDALIPVHSLLFLPSKTDVFGVNPRLWRGLGPNHANPGGQMPDFFPVNRAEKGSLMTPRSTTPCLCLESLKRNSLSRKRR
jgi:hypothetical protein